LLAQLTKKFEQLAPEYRRYVNVASVSVAEPVNLISVPSSFGELFVIVPIVGAVFVRVPVAIAQFEPDP